jgi:hypothetical protein
MNITGVALHWLLLTVLFLAPARGTLNSRAAASSPSPAVSVLYAGSLGTVMEHGLGPVFTKATGIAYQGEAQGLVAGAQMIRGHLRTPDVFISVDPSGERHVSDGRGERQFREMVHGAGLAADCAGV